MVGLGGGHCETTPQCCHGVLLRSQSPDLTPSSSDRYQPYASLVTVTVKKLHPLTVSEAAGPDKRRRPALPHLA